LYPQSNRQLAEQIKKRGYIASEYVPGTHPDRTTFPERNRIISGLADGLIVVEAGQKSGALITAEFALAQGRELFAVPGAPGSKKSVGTNQLLRQGAKLVTCADDVFEELPRLKGQIAATRFRRLPDVTPAEKQLTDMLVDGPLQVDQLARATAMTSPEVMELLLALELKGVIEELPGKRYLLKGAP
jgi:DNA processing protein